MLFVELRFGLTNRGVGLPAALYIIVIGSKRFSGQLAPIKSGRAACSCFVLSESRVWSYFRIAACALRFSTCQRWNVLMVSAGIKRTCAV